MRDLTKSSQFETWEPDPDWTDMTMDMLREAMHSMRGITTRTIKIKDQIYYVARIGEYYPFDFESAMAWCESQFGPENARTFPYTWFLDTNNGFVFNTDDKRVAFLLKWGNSGKKD